MTLQSTKPETAQAKKQLRAAYRRTSRRVWLDLEKRLFDGKSSRTIVNLSRLARHTKKGDYVVVPGKLLGFGQIEHEVTVGALGFSESARNKLVEKKCKAMLLSEFVKKYSKKVGVKIIA